MGLQQPTPPWLDVLQKNRLVRRGLIKVHYGYTQTWQMVYLA